MHKQNRIILIQLMVIILLSPAEFGLAAEKTCLRSNLSPKISIINIKEAFPEYRPLIPAQDSIDMHWKQEGKISDIKPDMVNYKDFNGKQIEEIVGLKQSVEIRLARNRHLFIMDDEHKVLPFWWKMLKQGIIRKNERFLHIDAHLDTIVFEKANKPIKADSSVKDTYELSFISKESGFLIPAFISRIIDQDNAYLMDTRIQEKAAKMLVRWKSPDSIEKVIMSDTHIMPEEMEFGLICVDLDALAGLPKEKANQELHRFARLCKKAKAVTIATSPQYMLDQPAAVYYAGYLTDLLLNEDLIQPPGTDQLNEIKEIGLDKTIYLDARHSGVESAI